MENHIKVIVDIWQSVLDCHDALTNIWIKLDSVLEIDNSTVDLENVDLSTSSLMNTITKSRIPKRGKKNNPSELIKGKQKSKLKNQKLKDESILNEAERRFGDCPICFKPLGQNPLASTKCAHAYCMKCLQQYLLFDQRCPTCRQSLRAKSSYHPLYLNKQ